MDLIELETLPPAASRQGVFGRASGTRFDLRAADGDSPAEIDLYDSIGGYWGITAAEMRNRLAQIDGDVHLRINSPGGDVFEGLAIFNDLVSHSGRVTVEVTGLAASMASLVAMAGDEIIMAENSMMMIHNAWTVVGGDRQDLRDVANLLDRIDGALARTYAQRSGRGVRTIAGLMNDETWFTAAEAKEMGLADQVGQVAEAQARFDLSVFGNVPDALKSDIENTAVTTVRDVERTLMHDAGLSRSRARELVAACKSTAEKTTQDAGSDAAELAALIAEATARITAIRGD